MRFMNYATLATAAAILFACNEDAKTKSDLRSNSTPGYSDEIAYFKAAGVEFNDENADANGLRLDAVSASQMSLNFKSLKIAYCGVNTTDYADPSVKDFSSKYCTFVTATTNVCRSARALSTSAEVVNSYNSLTLDKRHVDSILQKTKIWIHYLLLFVPRQDKPLRGHSFSNLKI